MYIFFGLKELKRGSEREKFSICWFISQMTTINKFFKGIKSEGYKIGYSEYWGSKKSNCKITFVLEVGGWVEASKAGKMDMRRRRRQRKTRGKGLAVKLRDWETYWILFSNKNFPISPGVWNLSVAISPLPYSHFSFPKDIAYWCLERLKGTWSRKITNEPSQRPCSEMSVAYVREVEHPGLKSGFIRTHLKGFGWLTVVINSKISHLHSWACRLWKKKKTMNWISKTDDHGFNVEETMKAIDWMVGSIVQ